MINKFEDECIIKISNLIKKNQNKNFNLINEIEAHKEIFESKKSQLTQVISEFANLKEKLNDIDEQIELKELEQCRYSRNDTQNYVECLLKENKEKYDIYIEQIDYYKELYQFDIKLIKEKRLLVITFLKNNQQITMDCTNSLVTYEENIEELIENCKYELMDTYIRKFNETVPKTNESIKELIISLNNIF